MAELGMVRDVLAMGITGAPSGFAILRATSSRALGGTPLLFAALAVFFPLATIIGTRTGDSYRLAQTLGSGP
jgi:hypothetical protein